MLVCVYYCAFGTRDRGCSRHPAFPAPSVLKRDNEFGKPRAKPCREIADAHSIPTSSRRTPIGVKIVGTLFDTVVFLAARGDGVGGPTSRGAGGRSWAVESQLGAVRR